MNEEEQEREYAYEFVFDMDNNELYRFEKATGDIKRYLKDSVNRFRVHCDMHNVLADHDDNNVQVITGDKDEF